MEAKFAKKEEDQFEAVIKLDKADLKRYTEQTEAEFGKNVKVNGFRQGKIPKDLLKKHLDTSKVLEVSLQFAIEDSLAKAAKAENLEILNVENLVVKENSADSLIYQVLITAFPHIELPDLTTLKSLRRPVKVEKKEIEDTLETIKVSRATYTDKDGLVEEGDRVEVDFEVLMDGKIVEGGISKNHPLIIGGRNFMPGFEESLVGMKKGEKKDFSLTAPQDYFNKDIAGKKLDFVVAVQNVQKVDAPDLNDDFVKTLGKFESVDQLTSSIKEGLEAEKTMRERQRVRLEILDQIIAGCEFKAPESLVNQQLDTMIQNFDNDLHKNGVELGLYLARLGKTQDNLRNDWRKDAERQVKINLILRTIIREKNLTPNLEEIEAAANEAIQTAIVGGQIDKDSSLDLDSIKQNISAALANEKALEMLESVCAKES